MSHYTALVFVRPDAENIEEEVSKLLAPFNENMEVPEYPHFLDEEDITRMRDFYQGEGKLSKEDNSLESLLPLMGEWTGHPGGIEDGHLYYLTSYNPRSKWDWYVIGGRWDGALRNDADCEICKKDWRHLYDFHNGRPDALQNNMLPVHEIPEDFESFAVVTEHGWHELGHMGWWAVVSDENEDWPKQFKWLKEEHQDHMAVLVDLHI